MLPISCVIIARNEAEALKRCLSSIHRWIKEIIVVINDCTDDTQKVAEQFGVRVIEHAWEGYAKQKNFGISCAQEAWILRLDADEEVSEALKQQIEDFFQKTPPADCDVVYCQRHNRYLNHWLRYGRSKDSCPILLRKRAVKWIGTVHEGLQYSGKKHYLQGPLWHYTETSIEQTLQKQIKYAHLSAPVLAQRHSLGILMLKCCLNPLTNFINRYILRGGFLDKFPGFYYATITSFYTFLKYLLAIELRLKRNE